VALLGLDFLLERALFWVDLDEACVQAYMQAPWVPPVVVFETEEGLRLVDGYHRAEAARRVGRKTIEADVRAGSWREALRYAAHVSRRPLVEPDEESLQERAQARENVKHFRARVGLPTDDAVLDWLMTQWDIGLAIYKTDEELERIAPLEALPGCCRARTSIGLGIYERSRRFGARSLHARDAITRRAETLQRRLLPLSIVEAHRTIAPSPRPALGPNAAAGRRDERRGGTCVQRLHGASGPRRAQCRPATSVAWPDRYGLDASRLQTSS
jgi:hypothetical protein